MISLSLELRTAIEAAKTGADLARTYYKGGKDLNIRYKEDATPVTQADIETERKIKQVILNQYPTASFYAEESGGNPEKNNLWIIDPIDGTRVFTHGIPFWSILIAFYKNNEVLAGVCYFPELQIMMYAEKNKGSYLNDKKVAVSLNTELKGAFGNFGSIRHFKHKESVLKLLDYGAVLYSYNHSYALSLIAAGKMDLCVDAYAKAWDYAPFVPIIQEAGGKITELDGSPWSIDTKAAVVSNGLLHDEILGIIKS
jgi:fructose-1,6-bisphosphatase/inositol monophosphatase family enzyme